MPEDTRRGSRPRRRRCGGIIAMPSGSGGRVRCGGAARRGAVAAMRRSASSAARAGDTARTCSGRRGGKSFWRRRRTPVRRNARRANFFRAPWCSGECAGEGCSVPRARRHVRKATRPPQYRRIRALRLATDAWVGRGYRGGFCGRLCRWRRAVSVRRRRSSREPARLRVRRRDARARRRQPRRRRPHLRCSMTAARSGSPASRCRRCRKGPARRRAAPQQKTALAALARRRRDRAPAGRAAEDRPLRPDRCLRFRDPHWHRGKWQRAAGRRRNCLAPASPAFRLAPAAAPAPWNSSTGKRAARRAKLGLWAGSYYDQP